MNPRGQKITERQRRHEERMKKRAARSSTLSVGTALAGNTVLAVIERRMSNAAAEQAKQIEREQQEQKQKAEQAQADESIQDLITFYRKRMADIRQSIVEPLEQATQRFKQLLSGEQVTVEDFARAKIDFNAAKAEAEMFMRPTSKNDAVKRDIKDEKLSGEELRRVFKRAMEVKGCSDAQIAELDRECHTLLVDVAKVFKASHSFESALPSIIEKREKEMREKMEKEEAAAKLREKAAIDAKEAAKLKDELAIKAEEAAKLKEVAANLAAPVIEKIKPEVELANAVEAVMKSAITQYRYWERQTRMRKVPTHIAQMLVVGDKSPAEYIRKIRNIASTALVTPPTFFGVDLRKDTTRGLYQALSRVVLSDLQTVEKLKECLDGLKSRDATFAVDTSLLQKAIEGVKAGQRAIQVVSPGQSSAPASPSRGA